MGFLQSDLKPSNVMIVPDLAGPGGERVKLLDFGIAKLGASNAGGEEVNTRTGQILGTAAYMSPEQFGGHKPLDGQSDVYSLACLMFRLLTGVQPFVSDSGEMAVAAMHMFKAPPALKTLIPDASEWLCTLVDSMMRKEPEQRPTMTQVAGQLQDKLSGFAHSRKSIPPVSARVSGSVSISGAALLPPRDPSMPSLSDGFLAMVQPKASVSGSNVPGTLTSAAGEASAPRPKRRPLLVAVVAGVALMAAGGGALLYLRSRHPPPAVSNKPPPPEPSPPVPKPVVPSPPPTTSTASTAVDKPLLADPVVPSKAPPDNPSSDEGPSEPVHREHSIGKSGKSSKSGKSGGKARSKTPNETQIIN